jgi:hypothetical protein
MKTVQAKSLKWKKYRKTIEVTGVSFMNEYERGKYVYSYLQITKCST